MSRIHELFDMAMFLLHEKSIIPLLQKLTESAIRLHERNSQCRYWETFTPCSNHDEDDHVDEDDTTMLLAPSFLNRLCEHEEPLWNMYCHWPRDLKFRQVNMTAYKMGFVSLHLALLGFGNIIHRLSVLN